MAEEQVANGAQDGAPKTGGKEEKGFFYGWWIVIGGFMIMATCYTAFVNCMSLFQAQIVGDLGMTDRRIQHGYIARVAYFDCGHAHHRLLAR